MIKGTFLGITRTLLFAAAAALCLWVSAAWAQDYPNKSIRIIVPAAAGGGTDVMARIVADGLTKLLGQSAVVENRAGASGMIGADAVLAAPTDGYTLLMTYTSLMAITPVLFKKEVKYDPLKDFVPVAYFVGVSDALIVNPSVQANSVAELIQLIKAQPGKFNYASSGNGTIQHLAMERFMRMAGGLKMVHVPYKGGGPATIDLMAGVVKLSFNNLVEVIPQAKAGRVRILAVASSERSALMPDVPTVAESGLPGFQSTLWYGVIAAAGTPAAVVTRLNEAVRQIQQMPEVKARLTALGAQLTYYTPAEFGAFIKSQVESYGRAVREVGLQPG